MTAPVPGGDGTAAPAPRARVSAFLRCVCDGARLMVGVPNYEAYAEHMRRTHPDKPAMTYAEFFRDRQAARYGGGGGGGLRCC